MLWLPLNTIFWCNSVLGHSEMPLSILWFSIQITYFAFPFPIITCKRTFPSQFLHSIWFQDISGTSEPKERLLIPSVHSVMLVNRLKGRLRVEVTFSSGKKRYYFIAPGKSETVISKRRIPHHGLENSVDRVNSFKVCISLAL